MAPLHGQKLVYLTPGGGFSFIFTLCIYFGVLFTIPVIIYQVYRFVQPLLKSASRRLLIAFMFISVLLASGGAAFGYFVTIPAALDFLATFAGDAVTPSLTAESYLNFVVAYVLGLALLFQLPLLLFIFDHVKPFPPGSLLSTQRFVIIGATIVAAIITPTPDAFNMAIVAVPIIAIYQVGVIAVFVRHASANRKAKARTSKQHAAARAAQLETAKKVVAEEENDFFAAIIDDLHTGSVTMRPQPEQKASPAKKVPIKVTVAPKTTDGIVRLPRPRPEEIAVPERAVPERPMPTRSIAGVLYARSPA